jgi:hypothetical protein
MTFHIFNTKGKLSRRGIVAEESNHAYVVYFCDALSGIPTEKKRVPKSDTAKWCWFAGVEESNAAYCKHFNVSNRTTPLPRFMWKDRELIQVVSA